MEHSGKPRLLFFYFGSGHRNSAPFAAPLTQKMLLPILIFKSISSIRLFLITLCSLISDTCLAKLILRLNPFAQK